MMNDRTKLVKEAKNDKASRCCWSVYQKKIRQNGIRRNATQPCLVGRGTAWVHFYNCFNTQDVCIRGTIETTQVARISPFALFHSDAMQVLMYRSIEKSADMSASFVAFEPAQWLTQWLTDRFVCLCVFDESFHCSRTYTSVPCKLNTK